MKYANKLGTNINYKKLIINIMVIVFCLQITIPVIVNAKVISGSEENISWQFDDTDGTLIFSGNGSITENWQLDIEDFENKVKKVKIENGITGIGREAFDQCNQLVEIEIPDSVTGIGWSAFRGCESLKQIQLPNTIKYIGEYAFSYCSTLKKINVPENVENINDGTFLECTKLKEINIPKNIINIGEIAFKDCIELNKIVISNRNTTIKLRAFTNCNNLTIYCDEGSIAESYAKENNIKYDNGSKKTSSINTLIIIGAVILLVTIAIIGAIILFKRSKTN